MTDTTGKRVARVKIAIAKRTVDALEPTGKAWIAWDDKLTGFVMYDHIPLIYRINLCSYFFRKQHASEFNQTPALAGASLA